MGGVPDTFRIDSSQNLFNATNVKEKALISVREGLVEEKGFFILPSELFANIKKKSNADMEWAKAHLNEKLEAVFRLIEESSQGSEAESDFAG